MKFLLFFKVKNILDDLLIDVKFSTNTKLLAQHGLFWWQKIYTPMQVSFATQALN